MLPIRDINPTRTTPFVNYLIVGANVAVFLWMRSLPRWYEPGYGLVPTRVALDPLGESFTIFTSMFMHANLAHLVGNMWFLWIFGDNIEDALGHSRYLAFYLMGGIVAAVVQVLTNLAAPIPMVGASGAIAAVTGAYLLLYPRAPILIMNPLPLLWLVMGLTLVVPAWLVAAEFFVMNLMMGVQTLHMQAVTGAAQGGVAVFAHLGGFIAGMLLIYPMNRGRARERRRAARSWEGWRPPPGGRYRY
jgi:membrane associated rhomboid family serine protease